MDDQERTIVTNPPLAAVTHPIRQAWESAFSGRDGLGTEFRYSA